MLWREYATDPVSPKNPLLASFPYLTEPVPYTFVSVNRRNNYPGFLAVLAPIMATTCPIISCLASRLAVVRRCRRRRCLTGLVIRSDCCANNSKVRTISSILRIGKILDEYVEQLIVVTRGLGLVQHALWRH